MTHGTALQITWRREDDGALMVDIGGDFDLLSVSEFKHATDGLASEAHTLAIVKLDTNCFLDSTGLNALMSFMRRLREQGCPMVVVTSVPRLLRVFRITGLDRVVPICQCEAEARILARELLEAS